MDLSAEKVIWYKTWWGIALIILLLFFTLIFINAKPSNKSNSANSISNTPTVRLEQKEVLVNTEIVEKANSDVEDINTVIISTSSPTLIMYTSTPYPTQVYIPPTDSPPMEQSVVNTNSNSSGYSCNCSKTCPNMSCEEAYFQLNQCGCSARDGDDDGIPCENVCN